jgi:hypothetical protein
MSVCDKCGERIEWFSTSDGRHIPSHPSGLCSGRSERHLNPSSVRMPCPKCSRRTWLVRSNGGTFWVDELGPPWPKHPCFDGASFRGNKPFTVGKRQWQQCDFCVTVVTVEIYSDHLKKCRNVEPQLLDHTAEVSVNSPRRKEIKCPICGETVPLTEVVNHNWLNHHGPRTGAKPKKRSQTKTASAHREANARRRQSKMVSPPKPKV